MASSVVASSSSNPTSWKSSVLRSLAFFDVPTFFLFKSVLLVDLFTHAHRFVSVASPPVISNLPPMLCLSAFLVIFHMYLAGCLGQSHDSFLTYRNRHQVVCLYYSAAFPANFGHDRAQLDREIRRRPAEVRCRPMVMLPRLGFCSGTGCPTFRPLRSLSVIYTRSHLPVDTNSFANFWTHIDGQGGRSLSKRPHYRVRCPS